MAKRRISRELILDYHMLEKMSNDLGTHSRAIKGIAKRIAKGVNLDIGIGLLENLDAVAMHIERAQKEVAKAKRELKRI